MYFVFFKKNYYTLYCKTLYNYLHNFNSKYIDNFNKLELNKKLYAIITIQVFATFLKLSIIKLHDVFNFSKKQLRCKI